MIKPLPILKGVAALAFVSVIGACTTSGPPMAVTAPQGTAQQATAEDTLSNRLRVTTNVNEAAPFVRESRPAQQEYLPVGVTPQRTGVQRSASELQSIEKELDGQRQRSRAYANRPKPPSPYDGRIPPRMRPAAPANPG